jgi:hypothetical protein
MGLSVSLGCLHDWEVEPFQALIGLLYSTKVHQNQEDRVCWGPSRSSTFEVKSYYRILSLSTSMVFPWKSIWKAGAASSCCFLCVDSRSWEDSHNE